MGQALPSRMFLFFCLSFVSADSRGVSSFLSFVRWIMGRRSSGIPHYDRASWSGAG